MHFRNAKFQKNSTRKQNAMFSLQNFSERNEQNKMWLPLIYKSWPNRKRVEKVAETDCSRLWVKERPYFSHKILTAKICSNSSCHNTRITVPPITEVEQCRASLLLRRESKVQSKHSYLACDKKQPVRLLLVRGPGGEP